MDRARSAAPDFGAIQYQGVDALEPGRSTLDLSHVYNADFEFGDLIPCLAEEVVPGDYISASCAFLGRMNPSIVPFMHEVNFSMHYFFVPYRLVWPKVDQSGDDWESYIVGDTWDPATGQFVENTAVLPPWNYSQAGNYAKKSLYDYLGFQPGVVPAVGSRPHSLWLRAYKLIFNEWFRDEDLVSYIDFQDDSVVHILKSAWEKDYFTSARPFQQKGIAPAFPVSGFTNAVFDGDVGDVYAGGADGGPLIGNRSTADPGIIDRSMFGGTWGGTPTIDDTRGLRTPKTAGTVGTSLAHGLDNNVVDFGDAVTFNVADLRLGVQIQRILERNARAGNRYTEWLQSRYGVSPSDARLQRPEYLGYVKSPFIISEVLQTSATGLTGGATPQGSMSGHGLNVARQVGVRGYKAEEFGVLMGICRVLPRTMYTSGVHRRAIRNNRYEFYTPELAHLSEQAVTKGELFVDGTGDNTIFGFQARYQEYRARNSCAVGEMRDTLKYWNLGRSFSAAPVLNEAFISLSSTENTALKQRAYAVTSEAPFWCAIGHQIRMSRPMPGLPTPGLMDHF